jgi:hypothetical protein
VELARHLWDSPWSLYLRTDFGSTFELIHDGYIVRSTMVDANGRLGGGETRGTANQATPMLQVQAGLLWRPQRFSTTRFFMGYQYERFWALDRLNPFGSNPPSTGNFWDQGNVLLLKSQKRRAGASRPIVGPRHRRPACTGPTR